MFRSDTVQYSVTYPSAFIPKGSIKAAAYFHSSFAVRLLAIKYPIKRTTLVTYTGRILRVNADRPKNIAPVMIRLGNTISKYGWTYAASRFGPKSLGSTNGIKLPNQQPSAMLAKMPASTSAAPRKRPNKYSNLRIGAVKKNA